MTVFHIENTLTLLVYFVLLAVKIYAFGSALLYPAQAYEAANKMTKAAWCIILGLAIALQIVGLGGIILWVVFTIAALVYLADVRPALGSLRRR